MLAQMFGRFKNRRGSRWLVALLLLVAATVYAGLCSATDVCAWCRLYRTENLLWGAVYRTDMQPNLCSVYVEHLMPQHKHEWRFVAGHTALGSWYGGLPILPHHVTKVALDAFSADSDRREFLRIAYFPSNPTDKQWERLGMLYRADEI